LESETDAGVKMEQAGAEVTVKFFADLAAAFGKERRCRSVPSMDVAALFEALCDTEGRRQALFADDGALRGRLTVLVNGRNILFLDGLSTPLRGDDVVSVFPPVYGG
jgi:MoaD family protein